MFQYDENKSVNSMENISIKYSFHGELFEEVTIGIICLYKFKKKLVADSYEYNVKCPNKMFQGIDNEQLKQNFIFIFLCMVKQSVMR
jgi:hypothetical protein